MRARIALSIVMGCLAGQAFAEDVIAPSHITAVTVYADRATVTRQAEIEIPAGASTVVLENLPAGLDTNSLRAQGMAEAAVTLGAVDSKLETEAKLAVPQEQALQKQLQDLEDKRDLLQADVDANDARKTFLTNLEQAPNPSHPHPDDTETAAQNGMKPSEWAMAGNTLYTGMADTLKLAVSQQIALRGLDQQIAALQTQMNSATGAHDRLRVSVPLEATAATKLTLKLVYQIPRATWEPLYDARLNTKTGKLDLTAYGKVRQSTGEDWTNVDLTLSTAQPSRGAEPPPMLTDWVYLAQRAVAMSSAGMAQEYAKKAVAVDSLQRQKDASLDSNAMAGAPVAMPAPAPVPVAAGFAPAQIESSGFVAEFHIVGPATIAADNSERRVMIGVTKASASLVDLVEPAYGPTAYLMARVKLAGDSPLLPGAANLFRDGSYIGATRLKLLQPSEETPLGFGIDDQVVVKRQVVSDIKGSGGTFSKQDTEDRKVVTHIHNLHKNTVPVEVREALPVARNYQITVDILDDTTTGYTKDADNTSGMALWKLDLAPDAASDVTVAWHVAWPAENTIAGLQ